MDQSTQNFFRSRIDARVAEIVAELDAASDSTKPIAPDVSVGRLSRLDSMQMQQMALAGKRRLEEQRVRLHEACRRIEAGTYGRCLRCDHDIAIERLQHQPDAVMCMPCLNAVTASKRGGRVGEGSDRSHPGFGRTEQLSIGAFTRRRR
jgi:DnaK suppressor protein